jgi:hypothetical protein
MNSVQESEKQWCSSMYMMDEGDKKDRMALAEKP